MVSRKYFVQERPYLDSVGLLHGFKDAQDILTAGYLKGTDTIHLAQAFFSDSLPPPSGPDTPDMDPTRPLGTRILPIYVLSLLGMEREMLLDHGTTLWSAYVHLSPPPHNIALSTFPLTHPSLSVCRTKDAVIVLQTDATEVGVPYISGRSRVHLHPRNSTQHIVAGNNNYKRSSQLNFFFVKRDRCGIRRPS